MKSQSSHHNQTTVARTSPSLLALHKEFVLSVTRRFIRYGNTNLNVLPIQPCILSVDRGYSGLYIQTTLHLTSFWYELRVRTEHAWYPYNTLELSVDYRPLYLEHPASECTGNPSPRRTHSKGNVANRFRLEKKNQVDGFYSAISRVLGWQSFW